MNDISKQSDPVWDGSILFHSRYGTLKVIKKINEYMLFINVNSMDLKLTLSLWYQFLHIARAHSSQCKMSCLYLMKISISKTPQLPFYILVN